MAAIKEMPSKIEHTDYWFPEFCHLMAGDTESAIATVETQAAHGHLFFWQVIHQLPIYELIRFEPRYQAAVAERNRKLAEQRELIAQMNLGKGP
jgi:hypothetical protein